MKKGQAEMVGLAIVVILLVISLLFYMSLKGSSQRESELVRSSVRANNILNAVLLVDTDEGNMKDLLADCVGSENDMNGPSLTDKCQLVEERLVDIFGEILPRQKYWFGAFLDDNNVYYKENDGDCEDFIKASSSRFPGGYKYEFKLCYS